MAKKGSNTSSSEIFLSDLIEHLETFVLLEFDGTIRHQLVKSPILRTPPAIYLLLSPHFWLFRSGVSVVIVITAAIKPIFLLPGHALLVVALWVWQGVTNDAYIHTNVNVTSKR